MSTRVYHTVCCTALLFLASCASGPQDVDVAGIATAAATAALELSEGGLSDLEVGRAMESCASRCSHECSGIDYASCILHCSTPNCHPSCCGCDDGSTGCDGCGSCGPGDQASCPEDGSDAL